MNMLKTAVVLAHAFVGWRPNRSLQPCQYYQLINEMNCEQFNGCEENL